MRRFYLNRTAAAGRDERLSAWIATAEMRIVFRSLYQPKLKMIEDECTAAGNVFAGAGFGRKLDEIGGCTDAQRAQ